MNFAAARRAGERRPLSKPSERLNMARSLLRPRLLDDGLVDAGMFNAGYADAMAGRSWRLTPADVLAAEPGALCYMLGFRAGELARRGGAMNATGLAGRREER